MAAKKKRWTEEAINNATKKYVLEGNLSVRRAAVQYIFHHLHCMIMIA